MNAAIDGSFVVRWEVMHPFAPVHVDCAMAVMKGFKAQIREQAREVHKILDGEGLAAEFVAPRLWEDSRTIDGGFTANSAKEREVAVWRALRSAPWTWRKRARGP